MSPVTTQRIASGNQASATSPAVWILTDRSYLGQRMPLALLEWLADHTQPRLVVADDESHGALVPAAQRAASPWTGLRPGDLVVTRSRHPRALELLGEAEARGARTCAPRSAVLRVRDKAACGAALAKRGVPVPATFLADRPEELLRLARDRFPIVVKPVFGDNARGVHIVNSPEELAAVAWEDELVLAQRYLDVGGVDLKVYVAGPAVWAVRRPSPLAPTGADPVPVPVTPAVRRLVEACRDEFGLALFGIDVLECPDGPVIADVNEFPNYTGIDEAPAVIGELLLRELHSGPGAASRRSSAARKPRPVAPDRARRVVVIGPGKLGCGLLAPLFADAGWETLLVARTHEAAERITAAGSLGVRVAGEESVRELPCRAVAFGGSEFERAIASADLVVTAVGVGEVTALGPGLARALAGRDPERPLDVWVVENDDVAPALEGAVRAAALETRAALPPLGFAGAIAYPVISRGGWDGPGRPVFVTDGYGGLRVDETRLTGPLPRVPGVEGTRHYAAHLDEKLLGFGAAHVLCAYLGARCGYERIDEAIGDPLLRAIVRDFVLTTRAGLLRRHPALGCDVWGPATELLRRFENRALEDSIARVARNPLRKLAASGRLMAAVRLARETTPRVPASFALGLASALHYRGDDAQALALDGAIARDGVAAVVRDVCGLGEGDPFHRSVVVAYDRMSRVPPRLAPLADLPPARQVPAAGARGAAHAFELQEEAA